MSWILWYYCVGSAILCAYANSDSPLIQGTNVNLGEALQFLREYDTEASRTCFSLSSAQWSYATNMTDANKRRMIDEQTRKAQFDKLSWRRAATFAWSRLPDPSVRRQLRLILSSSRPSLPDDKYNEIHHLIAEMKDIYSRARLCPHRTPNPLYCDLDLADATRIMANSRSFDELAHTWREWHDAVGPPMKNKFMRYVQIANLGAQNNGYRNAGAEMRAMYDEPDFMAEVADSWRTLQPLYKELFTYVRRRLRLFYGPGLVRPEGPLPAHLLGNLWAQDWSSIYDLVAPYPDLKPLDATNEMLRQGYTPLRMFQIAEEFYTSLGMKALPPEFWRGSMIDKPNDRQVQCTSSAWDFCNRIDYRIKQCTEVTMADLGQTHHEMAHIQYYLFYADEPILYRSGANPGFHEGVANAVGLSVMNPAHLRRLGLFNGEPDAYETSINFLMQMALKKVAFAPFAFLVDMWRYEVFQSGVHNMNSLWWELRLRHQGLLPPFPRTESHFDAGAKRHIPADIPYMQYYVALLLEFQLHYSMCYAAQHPGPLHVCDIYRSREAGRILTDLMKVGKARHWKEVLRMVTRGKSDELSAEPMLQYFQPLLLWLRVQNKNESLVGWTISLEEEALFQPYLANNAPKWITSCLSHYLLVFYVISGTHYVCF